MQRAVVNGETGEIGLVELDASDVAEVEALQQATATREAAESAVATDLMSRRAAIVGELQAIRDAATWPAARVPLLRVLVFVLRRLGERDA